MEIVNATRGTTLATKARRADSFAARARGLMMSPPLSEDGGLVIEPCNSIHMFFMRYPLDIVFLDKAGEVVFMYRGIKPWRMGRIVKRARLAIELPEGVIDHTGTQVGDRIRME